MTTRTTAHQVLRDAEKLHREGKLDESEFLYHKLLNKDISNIDVILQIAQIHHQKGNHGLAIILYRMIVDACPDIPGVWNNLAICLKLEALDDSAEFCFKKAMELEPDNPDFPANISAIYVNRGKPEKIIEWADKSIAIGPHNAPGVVQARWHKALALLEKKNFSEGWEYHEARYEEGAGCKIAVRNYEPLDSSRMTSWWDGESEGLVVLHGEQGLGDEIMFASCIPDALATGADLVFECAPRIASLMRRSFPQVKVIGTDNLHGEDWLSNGLDYSKYLPERVDYKLGIGSLPRFYRKDESQFPGTPYLIPDSEKVEHYRKRLDELGPNPKIGIAWMGGVLRTCVEYRSVFLNQLLPILSQDFDFISLQYTSNAQPEIDQFRVDTGIEIHHWPEAARGSDMDNQAALIANLDLVITVCQTAVHVAGGLGVPCWVLTPSRPSWRYGIEGQMPWYSSVSLFRQKGDDWDSLIKEVASELKDVDFRRLQKAKQEVA